MPAVVVTGARQSGKSTLAEHLVPGKRRYVTLDELDVLDAARRDPESLAGRAGYLTLWPMTRRDSRAVDGAGSGKNCSRLPTPGGPDCSRVGGPKQRTGGRLRSPPFING